MNVRDALIRYGSIHIGSAECRSNPDLDTLAHRICDHLGIDSNNVRSVTVYGDRVVVDEYVLTSNGDRWYSDDAGHGPRAVTRPVMASIARLSDDDDAIRNADGDPIDTRAPS